MDTQTSFYIIIAGITSFILAFLMYKYKSKTTANISWTLLILRFLTLFALGVLIINPTFNNSTSYFEKPQLPVLIDNSASIKHLEQTHSAEELYNQLRNHSELNDKFDISYYSFGNTIEPVDSLNFDENNTNIASALKTINNLYRNQIAPTVLVTDGNQTIGTDYEFAISNSKNQILPVILGDSIVYPDLKIEQLNTNRYAFLKNKFPVEIVLSYNGSDDVDSELIVYHNEAIVYRQSLEFSKNKNSHIVNFTLPAEQVGVQKYRATLTPLENEKNATNNTKSFAVEVIDQATQVLMISSISHPDIGAFKRAVTSNEQRTFELKNPAEAGAVLEDYQLIVLYQPDQTFGTVFNQLETANKNYLIISGHHTNWNSLNRFQPHFQKNTTQSTELIQGSLNESYSSFAIEDIGFSDFPPLYTTFGNIVINGNYQTILNQTVNGLNNENPLLTTLEISNSRYALWDGDGFWRWRAKSYRDFGDFQKFDDFIGNIIQYLASQKKRERLEVTSENFYYNNRPIKIFAQFFDKNYVFDPRANLQIRIRNTETEEENVFPMLLKSNFYEVDLGNLTEGEYSYAVSVSNESLSKNGTFSILDFDMERQFLNANVSKLQRVAQNTSGVSFFANQGDELIQKLLEDDDFKTIKRTEITTTPLIDWKYLLGLIVLFLTAEWFIRKYKGLI